MNIGLNRQMKFEDVQEASMNNYWNERSSSYSEMNMRQFYSEQKNTWEWMIFSRVKEDRPLNVLDIGTGPGFFAILAALRGHKVTAVDMNGKMLVNARKNARRAGVQVNFQQVGHELPFPEKSFDLILSRDVTWTLTEPEKQLRTWVRILKEEGTLLYFDAEWNFHLRNQECFDKWQEAKKAMEEKGLEFYSKAEELDQIAATLPMTYRKRPEWDAQFWRGEKMQCSVHENLNSVIFNEEEQLRYQLHPVFLVEVRR